MKELQQIINNLIFDNEEIEELQEEYQYNFNNPAHVARFIDAVEKNELTTADMIIKLKNMLSEFADKTHSLTKEEIKEVYQQLKSRAENPRGAFDKAGRFYVTDNDLLDVRSPSARYPYSEMNAARTAKFLKALADKYNCETQAELEAVAFA